MTRTPRTRTQAERDATKVEISFALMISTGLAGLCFLTIAGGSYLARVPDPQHWMLFAQLSSVTVFVTTVLCVLLPRRRFRGSSRQPGGRTGGQPNGQPSQPGRTSPDS